MLKRKFNITRACVTLISRKAFRTPSKNPEKNMEMTENLKSRKLRHADLCDAESPKRHQKTYEKRQKKDEKRQQNRRKTTKKQRKKMKNEESYVTQAFVTQNSPKRHQNKHEKHPKNCENYKKHNGKQQQSRRKTTKKQRKERKK